MTRAIIHGFPMEVGHVLIHGSTSMQTDQRSEFSGFFVLANKYVHRLMGCSPLFAIAIPRYHEREIFDLKLPYRVVTRRNVGFKKGLGILGLDNGRDTSHVPR